MNTKHMEQVLYKHLKKPGVYLLFECAMPRSYCNKYHRERVDLLQYETNGTWRFYELKLTVSDFHSNAKKTFLGNYNYYVMPKEVYEKVKEEIDDYIGCIIIYGKYLKYVKKPKKQELRVNHNDLMFAMMQGLSREYDKYVRKGKYETIL